MRLRIYIVAALSLAVGGAAHAADNTTAGAVGVGSSCRVEKPDEALRPGWFVAAEASAGLTLAYPRVDGLDTLSVQPFWTSEDGDSITFSKLAERAAPILTFSSVEFLRLQGLAIPSQVGDLHPTDPTPTVYYRIREVRMRRTPTWETADAAAVRNVKTAWSCGENDRRIDTLESVVIRYFFYYPMDAGIGGHPHDLESLEVRIASRPICVGRKGQTGASTKCFYALTAFSVSGSAHGTGWYTNVLDVYRTADTLLPLSVMVERDKHATSPDRDGNGKYMPHYDTNRYTKDAWGVRDVVASGFLGGASFRAEFADDRNSTDRVFPPASFAPHVAAFKARNKAVSWPAEGDAKLRYRLLGSESAGRAASVCDTDGQPVGDDHLRSLLSGKDFCGHSAPDIVRPYEVTTALSNVLEKVSPGPSSRYGFMSYSQRLSFSARVDHGLGASAVVPLGLEVKFFGGWLVPKTNFVPFWTGDKWYAQTLTTKVRSFSTEALYAPSGSRVDDWYISLGAERAREDENAPLRWGTTAEAGVKYRFNIEKLQNVLLFKFVGVRAALRTTGFNWKEGNDETDRHRRDTRLIFEIGAGAW